METFAERLRAAREKQGLTVGNLSLIIDVASSTLYAWEGGKCKPTLANLRKLAMGLNVTADELQYGDRSSAVARATDEAKKLVAAAAGVPVGKVAIKIRP